MKAIVDKDTCIGCGLCPEESPAVFRMDGDKAVVHTDPVPEEAEESCRRAADKCPVDAISVKG
ncbi:MAG: ferredoxin [Candidatus Omnitrophica bacterium]|nr:ferredoxin [Candidatus Omnitrophota bacterium]